MECSACGISLDCKDYIKVTLEGSTFQRNYCHKYHTIFILVNDVFILYRDMQNNDNQPERSKREDIG